MNTETIQMLLVLILLAVIANLVIAFLNWWRHDGLASRVTRLEAQQASALSAEECRRLYERLSNIEGRVVTTNELMRTVQQHLLENDA